MAVPTLKFASISLAGSTIYSSVVNRDSFIQVRATYVVGENTATVYEDRDGYFGSGSIQVGYDIRSVGEVSTAVTITGWDPSTKVITFDGVAEASNNGITRINLPPGKILIESASFAKVGGSSDNPPNSFRDVTGSSDPEYNNSYLKWGVIAQLASTSSVQTPLPGLFGQYELSSFDSRISTTQANIFLTASNTNPGFKEKNGYSITRQDGISSLFLSEFTSSLMTIASSDDISGQQSLGLAAYGVSVGSVVAAFSGSKGTSAATFPFTGSAQITGSLSITGSSTFALNPNQTGDFFLIKSSSFNPLKVNSDGVAIFGKFLNTLPTAREGGIAYSGSNLYVGLE